MRPLQPLELYERRITLRRATGAPVAADSLPTATLLRDAADSGVPVTVTAQGSGEYGLSFTAPADVLPVECWQLQINATIAGRAIVRILTVSELLLPGTTAIRAFVLRDDNRLPAAGTFSTVELWRQGTLTGEAVTITPLAGVGLYKAQFDIPPTWLVDDELQLDIPATVAGRAVRRDYFVGRIGTISAGGTDNNYLWTFGQAHSAWVADPCKHTAFP